jgi:hypothetical protein
MRILCPGGHFGYDDDAPTHMLIVDREKERLYISQWREGLQFVEAQLPQVQPMSEQQWAAMKAIVEAMPGLSVEEMRDRGMFELWGRPSEEQLLETRELVQWLDKNIDPVLERAWLAAIKKVREE